MIEVKLDRAEGKKLVILIEQQEILKVTFNNHKIANRVVFDTNNDRIM
jgi:hypothetical protein